MAVSKSGLSSTGSGAGEKKRHTQKIALLFTDMKGSTDYYKKHGDLAGRIAVEKIHQQLFSIVSQHHGVVVKTIGDSIMAYFYSAQDALQAATEMQLRMKAYNQGTDPDERIQIKIAVNWGYGIIEENDVFGDLVNVAGKVISFCPEEKIYVTEMFFKEVNSVSGIAITPLTAEDQKKIENITLYEVDWKSQERQKDENAFFLLSLKSEGQMLELSVKGKTDSIKQIIERNADSIVNFSSEEVNAVFFSSEKSLEAAFECLKAALVHQSEMQDSGVNVRAGIHAVAKLAQKGKADINDFKESIRALRMAQPGEVVVTDAFFQFLDPDSKKLCKTITANDSQPPCYRYLFRQTKGSGVFITSLFPSDLPAGSDTACFYCGSFVHEARFCPSKFIQKKTHYIERLGYIPFAELFVELNRYLPGIVAPLTSNSEDDRFSLLFNGTPSDRYSIYFYSFYEVSEMFQLRTLHNMFFEKKILQTRAGAGDKQSDLLLGEDCLRVSRLDEADQWFKKALLESDKDYRPLVGLGVLAVEHSEFPKAVDYFNNALAFSLSDQQKACLYFLIARVYEIVKAYSNCLMALEKALSLSSNHHSARFYKASVLCQMNRTAEAFEIFKGLVNSVPKYFFMMALNPSLFFMQQQTTAFLNRYIDDLNTISQKSYHNIEKNINLSDKWFDKKNDAFVKAFELYHKAMEFINLPSLYGLMDIHAYEATVDSLMKSAFSNRQNQLRRQISSIKNSLYDFSVYMDRFPYKGVISKKHLGFFEKLRALYEKAKAAVESGSADSLKEAQQVIDQIVAEKNGISVIRKRLESLKKVIFVMEAFLHFAVFFLVAGGLSTLLFVCIIVLYNAFDRSLAEITTEEFISYIKFGLIAGFFSGLFGTSVWFKKIYKKLVKKLE